jgi:malate dehydrogenase
MAIATDGSYGIGEGIFSGHPCTCSGGQYEVVQGLDVDDFSQSRIDATIKELGEERDAVRKLCLV